MVIDMVNGERPIDKHVTAIAKATVSTTQLSTTLQTASFPCTVMGLRWQFEALANTTTNQVILWAIVVVRDGEAVNTMSATDAATFYAPEQNILAHGIILSPGSSTGNIGYMVEGSIKTKRKLLSGDALVFICLSSAASSSLAGVVQHFCMT